MICKKCGQRLMDNETVCPRCGAAAERGDFGGRVKEAVRSGHDRTDEFDRADVASNKAMGGLAYLLFFLPLIVCPASRYGRFHANQGLVLAIFGVAAAIVVSVLTAVILAISWRLWALIYIIELILWAPLVILEIMGLYYGFSGKAKELPLIGKIRIIKYDGGKQ